MESDGLSRNDLPPPPPRGGASRASKLCVWITVGVVVLVGVIVIAVAATNSSGGGSSSSAAPPSTSGSGELFTFNIPLLPPDGTYKDEVEVDMKEDLSVMADLLGGLGGGDSGGEDLNLDMEQDLKFNFQRTISSNGQQTTIVLDTESVVATIGTPQGTAFCDSTDTSGMNDAIECQAMTGIMQQQTFVVDSADGTLISQDPDPGSAASAGDFMDPRLMTNPVDDMERLKDFFPPNAVRPGATWPTTSTYGELGQLVATSQYNGMVPCGNGNGDMCAEIESEGDLHMDLSSLFGEDSPVPDALSFVDAQLTASLHWDETEKIVVYSSLDMVFSISQPDPLDPDNALTVPVTERVVSRTEKL